MTHLKIKPGEICAAWWHRELGSDTGFARRTRAELRRAGTTLEVLGVSAVHDLNRELQEAGYNLRKRSDGPDRLALIARALAHITEPKGETLACKFGAGNPPTLSSIRFDALIRTENPRDLGVLLIRAMRIAGGGLNLQCLANDLYWWNEKIRTNWCFDYHGASSAKPETENKETLS